MCLFRSIAAVVLSSKDISKRKGEWDQQITKKKDFYLKANTRGVLISEDFVFTLELARNGNKRFL